MALLDPGRLSDGYGISTRPWTPVESVDRQRRYFNSLDRLELARRLKARENEIDDMRHLAHDTRAMNMRIAPYEGGTYGDPLLARRPYGYGPYHRGPHHIHSLSPLDLALPYYGHTYRPYLPPYHFSPHHNHHRPLHKGLAPIEHMHVHPGSAYVPTYHSHPHRVLPPYDPVEQQIECSHTATFIPSHVHYQHDPVDPCRRHVSAGHAFGY